MHHSPSQLIIWQQMYSPFMIVCIHAGLHGDSTWCVPLYPAQAAWFIRFHISSTNKPNDRPTKPFFRRPGPPASRSAQQSSKVSCWDNSRKPYWRSRDIVLLIVSMVTLHPPCHFLSTLLQGTASAILQPLFLGVQPLRPGQPAPTKMGTPWEGWHWSYPSLKKWKLTLDAFGCVFCSKSCLWIVLFSISCLTWAYVRAPAPVRQPAQLPEMRHLGGAHPQIWIHQMHGW